MLAEKWRPKTFEQVIGQARTVAKLRQKLDGATGGMAILLTGPSGSGKTTLAECAAEYWGIPEHGRIRIESATCTVDRLDELADSMRLYGPGRAGRKMYLIDEVHTITGRAADRLLSLLESIPSHVLIVGTTTEADWTGGILLSRWSRMQLDKPPSAEIAALLERVAQAEGFSMPPDPAWAAKLVKYNGCNLRDQLNQLSDRLFDLTYDASAATAA